MEIFQREFILKVYTALYVQSLAFVLLSLVTIVSKGDHTKGMVGVDDIHRRRGQERWRMKGGLKGSRWASNDNRRPPSSSL